eukprot:4451023-Prorocentrum_lima.AAC.1
MAQELQKQVSRVPATLAQLANWSQAGPWNEARCSHGAQNNPYCGQGYNGNSCFQTLSAQEDIDG